MRCLICGYENQDAATICDNCGEPLEVTYKQTIDPEADPNNTEENDIKKATNKYVDLVKTATSYVKADVNKKDMKKQVEKLKKVPKKMLFGILASVVIVIVIIFACINAKPTIHLDDYVYITESGYDGSGSASIVIDWEKIEEKYEDRISINKKNEDEYFMMFFVAPTTEVLSYYVSVSLDEHTDLSNGDQVGYTWHVNEHQIETYLDCNLKYENQTIEISNLESLEDYDPFEDLKVTFLGAGYCGMAELIYEGDVFTASDFSIERETGLRNGDVVTVSLDVSDVASYKKQGKNIVATEKEYVVSGLGKFASNSAEIDEASIQKMTSQAEFALACYLDSWGEFATLESVTCLGDYFLSAKDNFLLTQNYYGFVYELKSTLQGSKDVEAVLVDQYFYVQFENIVVNEDGTCDVNMDTYTTPMDDFSKTTRQTTSYAYFPVTYYYEGYETLEELKDAVSSGEYSSDWNLDEEQLVGFSTVASQEASTEVLCTYSSDRKLTKEDVKAYLTGNYDAYQFPGDRTIIQMLINEMYAKEGYVFTNDELQTYFEGKDWYVAGDGNSNDMGAIYESMSDIEKANVDLLKEY